MHVTCFAPLLLETQKKMLRGAVRRSPLLQVTKQRVIRIVLAPSCLFTFHSSLFLSYFFENKKPKLNKFGEAKPSQGRPCSKSRNLNTLNEHIFLHVSRASTFFSPWSLAGAAAAAPEQEAQGSIWPVPRLRPHPRRSGQPRDRRSRPRRLRRPRRPRQREALSTRKTRTFFLSLYPLLLLRWCVD